MAISSCLGGKLKSMLGRINTARWLSSESYDKRWFERSELLFGLLDELNLRMPNPCRVAEFGCGPNSPIAHLCTKRQGYSVQKFDLKAWDEATRIIDLNNDPFPPEKFEISTFSGVLEYLNDVRGLLQSALDASTFVLFSYACCPPLSQLSHSDAVDTIKRRIIVDGWRTHYSLKEILSLASGLGTIANVGHWRGQVLVIISKSDVVLGSTRKIQHEGAC